MWTVPDAAPPLAADAGAMYEDMNGWAWLLMAFGAIFWIAMLGGVVYVALRFAQQRSRRA
jgi:hypothetical protein